MPSEGLQRLQRLSANTTPLPTVQPKTPPRHKKKGSFATNILFLPVLALLLVVVALLTPGLSDFLPHSRHHIDTKKVNNGNGQGTLKPEGDVRRLGEKLLDDSSSFGGQDGFGSGTLQVEGIGKEEVLEDRTANLLGKEGLKLDNTGQAGIDQLMDGLKTVQTLPQTQVEPEPVKPVDMQEPLVKPQDMQELVKEGQVDSDSDVAEKVGDDAQQLAAKQPEVIPDKDAKSAKDAFKDDGEELYDKADTSNTDGAQQKQLDSLLDDDDDDSSMRAKQVNALTKEKPKDLQKERGKEMETENTDSIDSLLDDILSDDDPTGTDDATADNDAASKNVVKPKAKETIREEEDEDGQTEDEDKKPIRKKQTSKTCTPSCTWHGTCIEGKCECVVAYSGKSCANNVYMSWPFVAQGMQNFTSQFEGNFILHKGMAPVQQLQVVEVSGAERLIASVDVLKKLLDVLPGEDRVAKGAIYNSCAVVGASGTLMHYKHGPEIDDHDVVMRFNGAPTEGLKFYVGSKTTHRVTNMQNWGYHESNIESIFVPASDEAVEGLLWNAQQPDPRNVYVFHPDFEQYVLQSFGFAPDTGMYGLLLALHRCRIVKLYGFSIADEEGVPYHYYDGCDTSANRDRDLLQRQVLIAFGKGGLFEFGDPCALQCVDVKADICSKCRMDNNFITEPEYPQAEDCVESSSSSGHYPAPWKKKVAQQATDGSTESD